jgi:phosphoglycerol transferase MdoB-like AlkP superfamily enzyme
MKKISNPIAFVLKAYFAGIVGFLCFRVLLLSLNQARLPIENTAELIGGALWMGLRFDTVISCYILFITALLLLINVWLKSRTVDKIAVTYTKTMFVLAFFLCSVDIPYFMFHSVRLSKLAFVWLVNSPKFVLEMIFTEPRFWMTSLIPLAAVSALYCWLMKRRVHFYAKPRTQAWLFLPLFLGMALGARGRLNRKSPIRTGTAFFSDNTFINVLGLNPVYTLMNSLKQREGAPLVSPELAMTKMRELYKIPAEQKDFRRSVSFSESMKKHNVVLVIMESMAAKKTGFLNGKNLTPNMDRLAKESLSFTYAYTAGIHTFNGVYSTLFSLPAVFGEHPMKVFPMPKVGGLATALKPHGYVNHFFVTGDTEFDNIGGFLTHNDFDVIHGDGEYPAEKILSNLGVPDHVMFDYSLTALDKVKEPFLAVYLTASDHGPYVVPKDIPFKPSAEDKKDKTTQYADWAIGKFIDDAKSHAWFENTLFVLVADHGSPLETIYDISLNYHHTPLFFYMPSQIKPQSRDDLISQIDIYPSVMGYLKGAHENRSLGIDIFSQQREFVPLNTDDALGALNKTHLYVHRKDFDSLYEWPQSKTQDLREERTDVLQKMRDYSLNLFQAGRELAKPL